MKFKTGVEPKFLSAPAWYGLHLADQVHKTLSPLEAVCTSTGEARHSVKRSRHYTGAYGYGFANAFDLRTHYVNAENFATKLRETLGDDYYVKVEVDHIHVHWAPIYNGH